MRRRRNEENEKGGSFTMLAENELEFAASHYTAHDLENAAHSFELTPRKETVLRIDYKVSGIGSNSCGPELLPKYRFEEKEFEYAFAIKLE